MNTHLNIKINTEQLSVTKQITIIQACLKFNLDIPRFCFHDKLHIAGNCRMCLVEIINSVKPIASCAMQISANMHINTNTILIKKAREGVLEFLLINHPLDCPICDQGGECDLQDQVMLFGGDKGRFYDHKRSVENKACGSFVKTVMTRCIHCTRCIRFLVDVAGIHNFGLLGRGSKIEVGLYLNKYINTELIGNIIDLCPVGALTSKPFAFLARSWELLRVETIDYLESLSSDICIDIKGTVVLRVLPRLNETINSNWISDSVRFSYDGAFVQRLFLPYINYNNILINYDWDFILGFIEEYFFILSTILRKPILFSTQSGAFLGATTCALAKDILNHLGSSFFNTTSVNFSDISLDFKNLYLLAVHKLNFTSYRYCIILGLNLRLELPLYNIFLRKLVLNKNLIIIAITNTINLTYNILQISLSYVFLSLILEGKNLLCNLFIHFKNSLYFLIGESCLRRSDFIDLIILLQFLQASLKSYINMGFGLLQSSLGRVTGAELGGSPGINYFAKSFLNYQNCSKSLIRDFLSYQFFLFKDDFFLQHAKIDNHFICYLGSNYGYFIKNIDIVLPAKGVWESDILFLNIENILRKGFKALDSASTIREDFRILLSIFFQINKASLLIASNFVFNYYVVDFFFFCYTIFFCNFNICRFFCPSFIMLLVLFLFFFKQGLSCFVSLLDFFLIHLGELKHLFSFLNMFFTYYFCRFGNYYSCLIFFFDNIQNNIMQRMSFRLNNISSIFNVFFEFNFLYKNFCNTIVFFFNYNFLLNNIHMLSFIDNYFMKNTFCLLSVNMVEASVRFKLNFTNYI